MYIYIYIYIYIYYITLFNSALNIKIFSASFFNDIIFLEIPNNSQILIM